MTLDTGLTVGGVGVGSDERLARIIWSLLTEPGPGAAQAWVQTHGALGALELLVAGELGQGSAAAGRLDGLDVASVLRGLARLRVRVLIPGDREWPVGLDDLDDPPHCLYVRGPADLATLRERGIALVGARAATPYGTTVARRMASDLCDRGYTVVSGAAYGIDAAAHEGALAVGGTTVAALACGLDRVYPAGHADLIGRIIGTGAVVSELPLGWAPYRQRFLLRNRLIAAATVGTVVVEAGPRSGSLNTANTADRVCRHVAMVPGPVTSQLSVGCHEWIRTRGASLVTDAADVLDLMAPLGEHAQEERRAPEVAEDAVEEFDATLWSAVPVRRGADLMTLAAASGLSATDTLAGLGRLVMSGLVERRDDRWRKVPAARRAPATVAG